MDNMTKRILPVMYVITALFLTGCGASVTVKKLNDKDKGIPYYLPKPYLLITRGFSESKVTETKTENPDGTMTTQTVKEQAPATTKSGQTAYSMKIIYLPDLRNTYGITINPGIGKSETKITLENGWKLTSLAENTDTQVAETITATAGLTGTIVQALSKGVSPVTEKVPDYSIIIYEIEKDGDKVKINLQKPFFTWPPGE